jgi:RNA polymerase sigma factor (sigma-70 family)
MGSTWFTTLAAIRDADPDWEAIACYREPVARFLRRTYPHLAVERFDAERGRFRDYLVGVVRNQVRRALRQQPGLAADPDRLGQVDPEQVQAVALEAQLLHAVRRCHDTLLEGGPEERQILYCFSDRLLEGLSYPEIAAKEGISLDAVKRRLQAARRGVLRAMVELGLEEAKVDLPPRRLARLAEAVQRSLVDRKPLRPGGLKAWPPRALSAAESLVDEIRAGVRWFPGLDSPDGQAFITALRSILDDPEARP